MTTVPVPLNDYVWEQGDDLLVTIIYTVDDQPITSDYQIRMDIAPLVGGVAGEAVYSFNSTDFVGSLDEVGPDDNEAVVDANGVITIKIPHSLSLPGGAIGDAMANQAKMVYAYDMFVRKPDNTQKKILQGSITMNRSITHWL